MLSLLHGFPIKEGSVYQPKDRAIKTGNLLYLHPEIMQRLRAGEEVSQVLDGVKIIDLGEPLDLTFTLPRKFDDSLMVP